MGKRLQVYEGREMTVTWDPSLCIHSEACVRTLPEVFDPSRARWIRPDQASPDRVAEAVAACPTGALRATRPGGSPAPPPPTAVVRVAAGGPLYLRGSIRVESDDGEILIEADAVALCRCGATANPPFCDGSHDRVAGRTTDEAP